jgi:hypothetical protein
MNIKIVLLGIFCVGILNSSAQVRLQNPSFEGQPGQDGSLPSGWLSCKRGSTPDILPGAWGVYLEPSDGKTFLGLITREDGSWESISQHLSTPMQANECYLLTLDLAHAKGYSGYNMPTRLRVWGGTSCRNKTELLAESDMIKHDDWKTYSFELNAKKECTYLFLEAYFAPGIYFSYKGNLLLDNCQVLTKCARAEVITIFENKKI